MEIIYQDEKVIVCVKPAGVLSTDEPGGLPELLRERLGGGVYTVHRLDAPVSGLMVLARSRRAASALSAQVRGEGFEKEYLAVVRGAPEAERGRFTDLLARDKRERRTYVAPAPARGVQEAVLDYEVLGRAGGLSLVNIVLRTGRTHQIRCQFSSRGIPLVGDRKYSPEPEDCPIALWSRRLAFDHPATGERMDFSLRPPEIYPWTEFSFEV